MKKLSAVLVLLALNATLHADTAAFPKYDSVFTIKVPEDMNVTVDPDAMVLRTKDENDLASFVFLELPAAKAHDTASASQYLESYLDQQLNSLKIEVIKRSPVKVEALNDGVKGLTIEAHGKKGTNIYYTVTAFSFDGKRYFGMVSLRSYTSTKDFARNKELKQSIAPATVAAGTVEFPKDQPIFQAELPKGWKASTRGDGTLLISSTTGQDTSTLWDFALRGLSMHGDATVKGFAERRAEEITKDMKFTELKCIKPLSEITVAGHKAFITTYQGKMKEKPFFFDLAIFSVDGMYYFYTFGLAPVSTGKSALEHQHEILMSVKAVK